MHLKKKTEANVCNLISEFTKNNTYTCVRSSINIQVGKENNFPDTRKSKIEESYHYKNQVLTDVTMEHC